LLKKTEIACIVLIAAILGGVVFAAFNLTGDFQGLAASPLLRFSSFEELKNFVASGQQNYKYYADKGDFALAPMAPSTQTFSGAERASQGSLDSSDFSSTNIQVEDVDEIDFVKTDGEYLYIVSGADVFIVKAYPAEEAAIVSRISLNSSISGLFIAENRLIAVGGGIDYYYMEAARVAPRVYSSQASVKVYDVTNKAAPVLGVNVTVDGNYFDSRMIGDYVYVIANQWIYSYAESEILLPRITVNDESVEVPATDIYYSNVSDSSYSYTMVVAVNVQDFNHEPVYKTFLLGSASSMYVSLGNIYLTQWDWDYTENGGTKTRIHRISVEGDLIEYMASGSVPGYVLNQFSMDEYNGYFRIATTGSSWRLFSGGGSQNNVYVLDMNLKVVGSIEDLASGETIYSARFVGKRGYLVTFKKIDPLFVIDLENPVSPSVLGYLKVTGYSSYLHPYDETHLIGIGKETVAAEEGDFAWYQGVKISLFDVADVEHPVEIGKYEIGDRGTDSPVLSDHKALLFDRTRNLLVLPIALHEIDPAKYGGEVPPYAYGDLVWQGAYVFNVSVADGLALKGRITHLGTDVNDYEHYVKRALYIDNVLFTISDKTIKMSNLDTLEEINQVQLP
jgi:uncharacterized secreted protein with C-terminal beta-propeller domain